MQVFTVTGLFAGHYKTKLHGTITGVFSPLIEIGVNKGHY